MSYLKLHTEQEIAVSHRLQLPYESPCNSLHGHNLKVEVELTMPIEASGKCCMLLDTTFIKSVVKEYDHKHLNTIEDLSNPTMENFAQLLARKIASLIEGERSIETEHRNALLSRGSLVVRVWESNSSYVEFASTLAELVLQNRGGVGDEA